MSGFGRPLQEVLAGAIAAGRATLRDLREDGPRPDSRPDGSPLGAVPPRLETVAQRTGKRLPPPLASTLLGEIDRNGSFRELVLETWVERGGDDPVVDAFLRRPEGWWATIVEAVGERIEADVEATIERERRRIAGLEEQVREGKERLRHKDDLLASAEKAQRDRVEAATGSTKAALARETARAARLEDELAVATEALASAEVDNETLRLRVAELTEQIRRLRAERAEALRTASTGSATTPIPRAPRELARFLDRLSAATAPYRAPGGAGEPNGAEPPAPLTLPPGISPDSAEAIDALIGSSGRFRVVIDGHNLLGWWSPDDLGDPSRRKRLVDRLGRFRRSLGRPVEVVFDSSLEGGRETLVSDGVVVRFASHDSTADDEIAAMAGGGYVVVSNDREVRERADEAGALVVWADALARWLDR